MHPRKPGPRSSLVILRVDRHDTQPVKVARSHRSRANRRRRSWPRRSRCVASVYLSHRAWSSRNKSFRAATLPSCHWRIAEQSRGHTSHRLPRTSDGAAPSSSSAASTSTLSATVKRRLTPTSSRIFAMSASRYSRRAREPRPGRQTCGRSVTRPHAGFEPCAPRRPRGHRCGARLRTLGTHSDTQLV